jgi:hypothetical protein
VVSLPECHGATVVTTACVFDYRLRKVEEEVKEESQKPSSHQLMQKEATGNSTKSIIPFTFYS